MDKPTFIFWVQRSAEMEAERNMWKGVAERLANPVHDPNCEYAASCTYCAALDKVGKWWTHTA